MRPGRDGRAREVARGLGGLLGLLAVVAGVPAALWLVIGWPLPHAVPSPDDLRVALTWATIPDEFFPKALATLAWLVWAQFVSCLAVEAVAALRGTMPARVLGAGWGSQAAASHLVAAALLLVPTSSSMRPAATAVPHRPAPVVRELTASPQPERPTPPGQDGETTATPRPHPIYVVQRRDTLWDIAERHLRDPLRWREIFALNRGRQQPDGRRLQDPDWIYPGWRLRLPADAVGLPDHTGDHAHRGGAEPHTAPPPHRTPTSRPAPAPAPPTTTRPEPSTATSPTTDQAPPPAPAGIPTPPPPTSLPATAPPTSPPGRTDSPPLAPGVPVPGAAPLATSPPPPASHPAASPTSHPAPATPPAAPPAGEPAREHNSDPVPVPVLVTAGLLGAGVLAALTRLRHVQQRRRRRGRRIPLPGPELARSELALRDGEDPQAAELLDLALRAMAAGLRRANLEAPEILAVRLGPETLEVLLAATASAAPSPFTLAASGQAWQLSRQTAASDLRAAAGDAAAPLPALVTIGHDHHGQLLCNLEGAGVTAVTGDPDHARALLQAIAVELATSSWADFLDLVLVGFGAELATLERVRVLDSLDAALPTLQRQATEVTRVLAEVGCGSVLAGRVAGVAADSWTPTLVLCASPPSPAELDQLASLVTVPSQSTIAVVVAGDITQARWTLEVAGGLTRIDPLGLEVRPQLLDPADYHAIASLLETASDDRDIPPSHRQEPAGDHPAEELEPGHQELRVVTAPTAADPTPIEPAPDVEVRVLGRVDIAGIDRINRGKSEELVVFLALHRGGVDADQLSEALWPGKPPAKGTLNTTTTVARGHLGPAADGSLRLPHAHNGIYQLHPSVGLDWARFLALAARGYAKGADGADQLREALELVRGRPFEAARPRSYSWALVDQAPVMESAIVDAADHLAELRLAVSDHAGAHWAARRGLLAAPYDERLYRRLMLAADLAGNPAGVEAAMEELLRRLEEDDLEPYDAVHDETRELYERLTRGRRRAAP